MKSTLPRKVTDGHAVYRPEEDTFLLADVVREYFGKRTLEIGVGSGYVTSELSKKNPTVIGTDIDAKAVGEARAMLKAAGLWCKVDLVLCDGADPFREECFDLVAFNPPYLVSEGIVDRAVDGREGGIEVVRKFVEDSSRTLKKLGRMVFILSDVSDWSSIIKILKKLGFGVKKKGSRRFFYEEIFALEASRL